jgi:hypothetical protein
MTDPLYKSAVEVAGEYADGAARWWTNEGPSVSGEIDYGGGSDPGLFQGYIGLVDERVGGMVAFGPPEIMERMADDLNLADLIRRVAG